MALDRARLKTSVYKTLSAVMERVPEKLAISAAENLAEVMSLRSSTAKEVVKDHLTTILEYDARGEPIDPRLLDRLVRRSFRSYGRYWAEGATLAGLSHTEVPRRMWIIEGEQDIREALDKGHGAILALPHIGSWEWGGAYLARVGMPMTSIAERLEPEELFQFFVDKRKAIGLRIEGLGPAATTTVMQTLKEGGLVGLLCDRDIVGGGLEVEMFGRKTTVPAGPATLALRIGAPLFVGVVYSGPGDHHTALINGPVPCERESTMRRDVARVTQDLVSRLEGLISRAPEQWHVFQPNFIGDTES